MAIFSVLLFICSLGYLSFLIIFKLLCWIFEPLTSHLGYTENDNKETCSNHVYSKQPDERIEATFEDEDKIVVMNKYTFNKSINRNIITRRF